MLTMKILKVKERSENIANAWYNMFRPLPGFQLVVSKATILKQQQSINQSINQSMNQGKNQFLCITAHVDCYTNIHACVLKAFRMIDGI